MKQTTWSIVTAVGIAMLLASCSANSPTAPKPTPQPTGVTVTLTASPNPASASESVLIVAQVTSGGGNVPDGTTVTFDTDFGYFEGLGVQEVIRTTVAGRATTTLWAPVDSTTKKGVAGNAGVLARVQGTSASTGKTVSFQSIPPATPTGLYVSSVSPIQGGMEGGDRVIISGGGFVQPLSVKFMVAGQPFQADVVYVSADTGSMTVITPKVAATPPYQTDQPADIVVTAGSYTTTLPGGGASGFTYLAQVTTPEIYALTPNSGPYEGGTKVVIAGRGFMAPVQVLFGTAQAQVTSSNYSEIQCIAPSITPTNPSGPVTVSVTVTNIANGKVSTGSPYIYGSAMFITAIEPPTAPQDTATDVSIIGQGFVAPVSITVTGVSPTTFWDVTTVSGTQITARTRPLVQNARSCDNIPVTVTVTNVDSGLQSTPNGQFTYQAVRPFITSVLVDGVANNPLAQCGGLCAACTTHTITIKGSGFSSSSTLTATLEGEAGGSIPNILVTKVDANTLQFTIQDISGFPMKTATCGAGGTRNVATMVKLSVTDQATSCSDGLTGALVINPCDTTTCTAPTATPTPTATPIPTPIVGPTPPIFGVTPTPTPTP